MSIRNAHPLVWSPKGASDTLDASTAFSGAMASLQDLIPDPTTDDLWQCRPAALLKTSFAGFNTPTFISGVIVLDNHVYGMIGTARNLGHDEPFSYNILTNTFEVISGVTALNTPVSPSPLGDWKPPSFALVGTKLIVTHPGFTGASGAFFGVLDISNSAAPAWSAMNTAPVALAAPPTWVAQFGERAWFLVNPAGAQPGAYFTDTLLPTQITNANQIMTFEDNTPLVAAAGLPLDNQLGGIIQSLMVFKGIQNIYQVTGDYALGTLTRNSLNVATGTLGPNTITPTTKGLAFMAPDGVRLIDFNARVSDPIGQSGKGITVPFNYALTPSRANASFNAGVYRIAVQNGFAIGNPQQEWWYDFNRNIWSGPHTTNVSMIGPYQNTFFVTMIGVNAKLFQSDQVQSSTSTYVENGRQLQYSWITPMLPDTDQMAEVAMVETTLHMALAASNPVTCAFQDQNGTILDSVTVQAGGGATIWGQFTWGQALWQGAANNLYPRQLSWHAPIVFRRGSVLAQGNCAAGVKIGRLHLRYQILGYLQQDAVGTTVFQGSEVTGSVTLTANATSTVVNNAACAATSKVFLTPVTPDAANDMATTSIVAGAGLFTITHANNARLDRTFNYVIFN